MNLSRVTHRVEVWGTRLVSWVGVGTAVGTGLGWLAAGTRWLGERERSGWLALHRSLLLQLTLAAWLGWTFLRLRHLSRRLEPRFSDRFRGRLEDTWDFNGPWRIASAGELLVTGSDAGGITKQGAFWENYEFTCRARILCRCLGVVVRAHDLDNYYMFQIQSDRIVPHRRVAVPSVLGGSLPALGGIQHVVQVFPAWQVFPERPLNQPLSGWFSVRVRVRGRAVWLYLNDELVIQDPALLENAAGRIGFRNCGTEEALVRDVRVVVEA